MLIKDIGEISLINDIARNVRLDKSVVMGIGDDAAVVRWTTDKYLLFTCDMLVEDVHFRLGHASPSQIGWKAIGRNISDIAAMGGVPRYALVSCGLNPRLPLSFIEDLFGGMKRLADRFKINIVGGDTVRAEKVVIDVSLVGEVEKRNVVFRNGAKVGDVILVTGSLGGSLKGKHLDFMPRLKEARGLVKRFKLNSMIDISDGLILDLWRVLSASRVGARIYQNAIPIAEAADSFEEAITQGEDFELLFTMSAKEAKRFFRTALGGMKTPVTLIGEITDKRRGYKLITNEGRKKRLNAAGYLHF